MKEINLIPRHIFFVLLCLCGLNGRAAVGDTFTANTIEGVTMTFKITSESPNTCQVGDGNYHAINGPYSGGITIPQVAIYEDDYGIEHSFTVTSIERHVFNRNNINLTSVSLPSTLTTIGEGAFSNNPGITSISIPSSVTTIGDGAFSSCGLTSIVIPASVTSIGDTQDGLYGLPGAFNSCSNLTSITVEAGNPVYDSRNNCNAIIKTATNTLVQGCNNTVIPSGVTSIGNDAFLNSLLESITIPEGVTSIGVMAFAYNSSGGSSQLSSVFLPSTLTTIGEYAFELCTALTSITIPSNVTSIGSAAFDMCSSLTSITIPASVTSIGSSAFAYCNNLTSVVSQTTTPCTISNRAFDGISNSCTLTIPTGTTSAYTAAGWTTEVFGGGINEDSGGTIFHATITGSPQNKYVTFKVISEVFKTCQVGDGTNLALDNTSVSGNVELPSTVNGYTITAIADNAFKDCSHLSAVDIPEKVTSIGESAFEGCTQIQTIDFLGTSTLSSIGRNAFYNCSSLYAFSLPSTVRSIGQSAFLGCYFTSISIPEGVTAIPQNGFSGCTRLERVTIPSTVTSIGGGAFYQCSKLKTIISNMTVPVSISGSSAFWEINSQCVVGVPAGTRDAYLAAGWTTGTGGLFLEVSEPATITARNCTKSFGAANPNFQYDVTGGPLAGGYPSLSTSATADSDLGTYDINVSRGTVNVAIPLTFVKGTMTIEQAPLTITAKNQGTDYGNSIQTGTSWVTVTGLPSGYTLSAITLTPSTTNVTTNGTITPSNATIMNGETDVTSKFNITYNTGTLTVYAKSASYLTLSDIAAQTYTGSVLTPAVTVTDGNTTLTEGTHYTIAYFNNTNAGTATVTITGKGNYKNTKNANFTINRKAATITAKAQEITYGSSISSAASQVTASGLVSGHSVTAITLTPSTSDLTTSGTITPSGATIKNGNTDVTSNYDITYNTGNLTINGKPANDLTIESIAAQTYTGTALTPSVTVKDGSTTLTSGTDYTVAYSNNTNAGTATVTITGLSVYAGTKSVNFTINKAPLTITAKSYTINEKDAFPTYEATFTGFVNNETSAVLTTQPTFTCTATDTETSGDFTITPSGATVANYNINYVNGTLTISHVTSVSIAMKTGSGKDREMIGYSSKYGLDFTDVTDVKAYIVLGYKNGLDAILLGRVKIVPPYTGIVIRTENPGVVVDVPTTTEDYFYANLLQPMVESTTIPATETIGGKDYKNFTVGTLNGGEMGFIRLTENWTSSNKCYLPVLASYYDNNANVRANGGFDVEIVDSETTDINSLLYNPSTAQDKFYDLQGRQVKPTNKGIYIHNGKKVFIK